jgi:SAM-dependent methyltransferase
MAQAAESFDIDEAERRLPETEAWIDAILARLGPYTPRSGPLDVLDVGAAQGRALVALSRRGHRPVGVEPWRDAIVTAHELGRRTGVEVDIREGVAEALPFPDESFDVVIATSVMEHVADLRRSLAEIARVLRPHGVFWFNSASALCPRQAEIRGFPCFGWYPLPLKRRVMRWAAEHRPALVGHTEAPAINWFTPRFAGRELRRAGFEEVLDRWDLMRDEEVSGARAAVLEAARRWRPARYLGDVLVSGCSFAAVKPETDRAAAPRDASAAPARSRANHQSVRGRGRNRLSA